jgi:hypothetical protein
MSTPISTWAPAFHWWPLAWFTPERIYLTAPVLLGGRICRLCEETVPNSELRPHAREHRREVREWRTREKREARKLATARLRTVNRHRRETRV